MVVRRYTCDEVDVFAAYCSDLGRCFLLPADRFSERRQIYLRLAPSRNNQRQLVNWADDYDFEWLDWAALKGP